MKEKLLLLAILSGLTGILPAQQQIKDKSNVVNVIHQSGKSSAVFSRGTEYPDSMMNFTWNGTDWDTAEIEIYAYDANGNVTELIRKYYDIYSGKFINSNRNVRIYNNDNQLLLDISYYWDSSNWIPSAREKHSYVNGFTQSNIYEYYDSNQWVFSYGDSTAFTFNSDKLPLTMVNYYYDMMSLSWVPSQKIELSYGADKKPSSVVIYEWDNKWKPTARLTNLKWDLGFNLEEAEPTGYIMQIFMLNNWINYEKFTAKINNGHKTVDSFYTWNTGLKKWIDSVYTTYAYENNLLTERFQWQYKWDKKMWDTIEIEVHGYDSRGNEVFYQSGSKWGDWFEWWTSMKKTYTYNQTGIIKEIIYENFDFYANEWYKTNKVKYFYKSFQKSNIPTMPEIRVYPVPATDKIYISGDLEDKQYQLFDMKGILQHAGAIDKNRQLIDLSDLPEGYWLLKIIGKNGETKVFKILKK